MQKAKRLLVGGSLLASILLNCKEIETTTRIFADGSIERIIVLNREPGRFSKSCFTLPVDSTWSISTTPAAKEGRDAKTVARKRFTSAGELQALYNRASARPWQVRIDVEVRKKFRWFYTSYEYRETYHAFNPYQLPPRSGYLSEKDLAAWIAAPDSDDTLDEKVESWLMAGVFEEFYQSLQNHAARLQDPGLTPAWIASRKERLRTALIDSAKEDDLNAIVATCERILGTPAVRRLQPALDTTYKVIEEKLEFDDDVRHAKYLNRVVMPGKIQSSNGQADDSSGIAWPVSAKQFFLADYTMWAQSRRTHPWMVALTTVGIVLLALAVFFLPRRQKVQS
ncbi:MAG TPA: hypothetical protein PLG50_02005 [bacterium]|nr:hypothetical protein [bacterium]HQG44416.1 hypothetical protein [bacterium]HQI47716.1 hypothetical protein [bacterium]HQJ64077.1 hypothetical protein [bacterium]